MELPTRSNPASTVSERRRWRSIRWPEKNHALALRHLGLFGERLAERVDCRFGFLNEDAEISKDPKLAHRGVTRERSALRSRGRVEIGMCNWDRLPAGEEPEISPTHVDQMVRQALPG